jgi:hypothetical protein
MSEEIKKLFSEIRNIKNKYDDLAKAIGNRFNIFWTMGVETREVKLHSALIAELLNPQGSH